MDWPCRLYLSGSKPTHFLLFGTYRKHWWEIGRPEGGKCQGIFAPSLCASVDIFSSFHISFQAASPAQQGNCVSPEAWEITSSLPLYKPGVIADLALTNLWVTAPSMFSFSILAPLVKPIPCIEFLLFERGFCFPVWTLIAFWSHWAGEEVRGFSTQSSLGSSWASHPVMVHSFTQADSYSVNDYLLSPFHVSGSGFLSCESRCPGIPWWIHRGTVGYLKFSKQTQPLLCNI